MKRFSAASVGLLAITLTLLGCASLPGQSGWTTLVDGGSGLENFDRVGDANWRWKAGPS